MWHRIDAKKIKGKTCLAHEHLKMPYIHDWVSLF